MLQKLSIKELYSLALAEGEGLGTAYEYYAKRLVLGRWLTRGEPVRRVLVTGLPQKYGASLDFALLAAEHQAYLTVVDERPEALEKFERSLASPVVRGLFSNLSWELILVEDLSRLAEITADFDLALSSETLQRLEPADRRPYLDALRAQARLQAVFCPNVDNPAHTNLSGLSGLSKAEVAALTSERPALVEYLDLPPFPPGLTRSDEQREQASSGRLEATAMFGLNFYARLERFIPQGIRRTRAHIVYALSPYPAP